MKPQIAILALSLALLGLSGCTSTGFLGLAKEDYVLKQHDELTQEIATLKTKLAEYDKIQDQIESLKRDQASIKIDQDAIKRNDEQLTTTVAEFGKRLDSIANETIGRIADILKAAANDRAAPKPSVEPSDATAK
jgi:septal ring factor EnvC (AmiA/AmiB activator)